LLFKNQSYFKYVTAEIYENRKQSKEHPVSSSRGHKFSPTPTLKTMIKTEEVEIRK